MIIYVAVCNCGWRSGRWRLWDEAEYEGGEHVDYMRRGGSAQHEFEVTAMDTP
jgi:hypothetical protein